MFESCLDILEVEVVSDRTSKPLVSSMSAQNCHLNMHPWDCSGTARCCHSEHQWAMEETWRTSLMMVMMADSLGWCLSKLYSFYALGVSSKGTSKSMRWSTSKFSVIGRLSAATSYFRSNSRPPVSYLRRRGVFWEGAATCLVRNECGEKCEKSSMNQICTISNKDWYRLVGIGVAQNLPKSMEVFDLNEMEPEIQIKYIAWCICSKIRDHIFSEPLGSSGANPANQTNRFQMIRRNRRIFTGSSRISYASLRFWKRDESLGKRQKQGNENSICQTCHKTIPESNQELPVNAHSQRIFWRSISVQGGSCHPYSFVGGFIGLKSLLSWSTTLTASVPEAVTFCFPTLTSHCWGISGTNKKLWWYLDIFGIQHTPWIWGHPCTTKRGIDIAPGYAKTLAVTTWIKLKSSEAILCVCQQIWYTVRKIRNQPDIDSSPWQSEDPGSCLGDAWQRGLDSSCPVIHTGIIERQRHQDCSPISKISFEGS